MTDTMEVLKNLQELGLLATGKAVSGPTVPPNHIYGHGAGGLFNTPCVDRGLFSAVPLPRKGVASLLPIYPTNINSPEIGVITGVTSTDDDPETNDAITGQCGRGPSAGKLKYCYFNNYPFADYSRSIASINIRNVGRMECRTDTMDYNVIGDPFNAGAENSPVPSYGGMQSIANVANNEASKALFEAGVAWSRDFARDLYTGNPDAAFNEWSQPFRGFDLLINTGYTDLASGNDCDRVDSYVADFQTLMSTADATIENNPAEIVIAIVEIMNLLYRRSTQMGLDPARWYLSMPYNMFRVLAYVWPCTFFTNRCTPATGYTGNLSAKEMADMTQDMLANKYLPVGMPDNTLGMVPVVCDDAITEGAGQTGDLASDIYFICSHILSSNVVTYLQYFDYNGPNAAMAVANALGHGQNYQTYDNGRFLAHFVAPEGTCIQTAFYSEPRLRVDTPFLCARLTDVEYSPIIQQESAFPGDETYLNGGNYGPNPGAEDTCALITECEENEAGVVDFTLDQLITCADAPFNTHVLITIKSGDDIGSVFPGIITAGDGTTSITVTFGGALAALTCADVDTFVGAEICCNFGDVIT